MMPQNEQSAYGGYEGQQREYAQPRDEAPFYGQSQPGGMYDDEYIDLLSQRIAQRMARGPVGQVQPPQKQRGFGGPLLLALVSIIVLIPLASILVQGVGGLGGLIAFGVICLTIFLINAVYDEYAKHVSKYK